MINKWQKNTKEQTKAKNTLFFKDIASSTVPVALEKLASSYQGLSEEKVLEKQKNYGKNIFSHQKFIWYKRLLYNLANPFVFILSMIVTYNIVSYVVKAEKAFDELVSAIIVLVIIVLNVSISCFQDYRSYRSAEKLNQLIETTASVFRIDIHHPWPKNLDFSNINSIAKYTKEILIKELVPGDIIFLSSGDMVPADVRLLTSTDIFVDEQALTGESVLVEKHAKNVNIDQDKKSNILELQNLCFMGTSIVSGAAIAVVVATGANSYFGTIASAINTKRPITSFNKGIKKISYILIAFMAVMLPFIFIVNMFAERESFSKSLIFAISLAVGLTPEMLPMIVSVNLSRGALKLASKKVVVKNLSSIQNFGAMDILCTDKTGTLTEERIELVKHLDPNGKASQKVLQLAYFNSFFQTGLKNNIDKTIIEHIKTHDYAIEHELYHKIDEIPFDFARRKMSVVIKKDHEEFNTLICKGAIEEILKLCTEVEIAGEIVNLDQEIKNQIFKVSRKLNSEGLRVIAVASKKFAAAKKVYHQSDETQLILVGYIGFLDIPKKSAITAIKALKEHGVTVKILTGDNEVVTTAICHKVGIAPKIPLLGADIEVMSDNQLQDVVDNTTIFAKMNPLQKARIIDILKLKGHTVGFLGDGINDAVALHHADVGISVNSATDIAKEASDIILLEKDLDVLEQGVIAGRITFGNILKYIKITISSSFGNCLSILTSLVVLPFLPMLGIQILLQNLLYDVSQLTIPFDNVDESFIKKPQKWEDAKVIPFALWNGPLSSIFDLLTFAFLFYVLKANNDNVDGAKIFQSGWFIFGITSQTLIFNLLRTEKIPFLQSNTSWPVLLTNLIGIVVGIVIPFTSFGAYSFSFIKLDIIFFVYLVLMLLLYFILSQLWKVLYIKINKRWI